MRTNNLRLYVIAHTWRDTDMTIEHFHSPEKTVSRISELSDFDQKPYPSEHPQEYMERYQEWIKEQNDDQCDAVICLEVIEF